MGKLGVIQRSVCSRISKCFISTTISCCTAAILAIQAGWFAHCPAASRAWPEEIANLRKLRTLTFEGNDLLKELPPLKIFAELKALKVTRRVNYRVPAAVAEAGGQAIVEYLLNIRIISEQLVTQKLVISMDPKAHWVPDKDAPG